MLVLLSAGTAQPAIAVSAQDMCCPLLLALGAVPGHLGLPGRKALQEKVFSYIPGKVHSLTPWTGDELTWDRPMSCGYVPQFLDQALETVLTEQMLAG